MFGDDTEDRTEAPTPRRRQEAREQGRIARSHDLTAAVGLLAALALLDWMGPSVLDALQRLVRRIERPGELTPDSLLVDARQITLEAAGALAPLLAWLVVLTAIGAVLQSGWVATWSRLSPKFGQLNPLNGLKRLASLDAATRLVMSLLKLGIIGGIAATVLHGQLMRVLGAGGLTPELVLPFSTSLIDGLLLKLGVAMLVLALLDYFYHRWQLERNLRMSKQEIKDELKRMEGDPALRQRRRQIQARLALQRAKIDVPKADVVVTNPTEYAVAIQYDEKTMDAPRVVAKGKDFMALHIRQIAQQHGIPIVQRPPLARGLYAAVEIGQTIPPAYYRAVAEVLAYVYQLAGKAA
ncbi:MAG: flagellar biosynthesis protein FlhB [Phycisphaerae bacterium]